MTDKLRFSRCPMHSDGFHWKNRRLRHGRDMYSSNCGSSEKRARRCAATRLSNALLPRYFRPRSLVVGDTALAQLRNQPRDPATPRGSGSQS